MSKHYHAAVWIDGHEARVFRFNAELADKIVIHNEARAVSKRREGHDDLSETRFLEAVTAAISDAGAILIGGPGEEKTWLLKHIERKHPKVWRAVEGVEAADHPTDAEWLAHARKTLKAEDRMKPQI